jgi:FdrA protein
VLDVAAGGRKPVVVIFLGAQAPATPASDGKAQPLTYARTLEEAARLAVKLAGGGALIPVQDEIGEIALPFQPGQKYVRGLFSGGTFCSEAVILLSEQLGDIHSNVSKRPEMALANPHTSTGHTCVDMGADEFTVGRPHPKIDMSARVERIAAEARDPEVAIILLDVVLGYGSSPDPAGDLAPAIKEARRTATEEGRELAVVAHVCGTDADPQGYESQRSRLREAGAILAPSNAAAARLAAHLALEAAGESSKVRV